MRILEEKLDKEKLLDAVMEESPIDAVEILLNLGKDIPKNIIDMIAKGGDNRYVSLKSSRSYILKDAFPWSIYDNIEKVSDNTINTIANNSDFDDQFILGLAHSFRSYKKEIPDILFKRISKSSWNSYSIAYVLTREEGKEIPEILWPAISKLPPETAVPIPASPKTIKHGYVFAERLRLKGIEIPYALKKALDGFLSVLNNKNIKLPDELIKKMENYKKMNESSDKQTITEALDKEKLVNTIQKNPDDYHEFIHQCIRDGAIIPDKILNDYFKDHPLFSKKEDIPPTYINGWVPTLFTYAYFLLEKNIEIPEIILKAISKSSQYSNDLIAGFLNKKINVPEILITSVSLNPSYSYYSAVNFIKNNRKVPEILNQTIEKNPMILNTYEQFLREIEMEKKVKEAYAFKEEVKESVIVNEKLDKEELLKVIENNPESSHNLAKRFIEQNKEVPENLVKSIAKDEEYALPLNYAMLCLNNNIEVPDIINDAIAKNDNDTYDYIHNLIQKKKIIPDIIINAHLERNNDWINRLEGLRMWTEYIRILLDKNEEIPEKVLKASLGASRTIASLFIKAKKETPEIVLKTIAKDPVQCKFFVRDLLANKIKVPEIIKNGLWDLERGELEEIEKETISEALDKEELLNVVGQDSFDSLGLAKKLLKMKKEVPDETLKGICKNSFTSINYARHLVWSEEISPEKLPINILNSITQDSQHTYEFLWTLITHDKKIPDILINAISKDPFNSKNIAQVFRKNKKTVPDIIQKTIDSSEYNTINEKLDKEELLNAAKSDSYGLAILLIKTNKDIPKIILKNLSKYGQPYQSEDIATYLIEHGKEPPDILIQFISKHYQESLSYARFLKRYGKDVPDIILSGVARNAETSFYYARFLIEENETVPEKILNAIAKSCTSSVFYAEYLMDNDKNIPEVILKTIKNENPNWYKKEKKDRGLEEKIDKEKLLNTVFDSWTDARSMIFDLSKMGKEIPDKLAILAVENMPASILKFVIEDIIAFGKNEVPEIMLKSISKDKKIRNNIAMVYKNYNQEIPKIIMDSLNSEQKEFYNSVWFTRKKPIEEKLDKNKLLDVVGSALDKSDILDFAFNLLHLGNELPDNILKIISDRPSWAVDHVKSIFSKNKIIDTKRKDLQILLKSLSEDVYQSGELIKFLLRMGRSDIPDVLLKSIARNGLITKTVVDVYILNRKKIPIILQRTLEAFKQKHPLQAINLGPSVSESQKTITEKLDKSELLGAIQKDYDAYIDIMNHYFWKKKEYPPEEFLKMATETDEASRIFAEYCLEHKKDIPEDVIKKVAENPRSAYTIAALMILEERKVPEILIKSIHSDPLSLKQFREFAKNEESRFHIPTSYYAKI